MNDEEMDQESAVQIDSSSALGSDGYTHLGLDPNFVPKLPDSATMNMTDIPLTWVSRGKKFYKMFKCRFCPHVNVRKANIQVSRSSIWIDMCNLHRSISKISILNHFNES